MLLPLPLQQSVRSDCRAHPNPLNRLSVEFDAARDSFASVPFEDTADTLRGSVGIVGRVNSWKRVWVVSLRAGKRETKRSKEREKQEETHRGA
jgi:hypothetical protein